MAKIALIIEYDGTRYHGFQWQANAATIQQEIENALGKLVGKSVRVAGASRTDAGVHARGQVVSFRTDSVFSRKTWVRALNFYLPEDIAVRGAYRVSDDFDVRRDAVNRQYRYCILNSSVRSPLRQRFAHLVTQPLDVEAMNQACQILTGEHDFAPFTSLVGGRTRRTVFEAKVSRKLDLVVFEICANSFLPHQVRNTVGGLIKVGLRKIEVETFCELARSGRVGAIGPATPAQGLRLMKVTYHGFPPLSGEEDENL